MLKVRKLRFRGAESVRKWKRGTQVQLHDSKSYRLCFMALHLPWLFPQETFLLQPTLNNQLHDQCLQASRDLVWPHLVIQCLCWIAKGGGVLPLVPQNNLGPLPSITLASWLPSSSSRYISEKLYVWYPWKRTSVPFLRTIEFELSTLVGQSGTETELLGQEDPHLPDQLCNLRQASELLSCCVCVCVF